MRHGMHDPQQGIAAGDAGHVGGEQHLAARLQVAALLHGTPQLRFDGVHKGVSPVVSVTP